MRTQIKDVTDVQDLMEKAGLSWGVHLRECNYENSMGHCAPIPGKFVVVRSDIDHPLGVVGRRYTPISNAESFGILDGLVDGGAKVINAGFYKHGQTVFVNLDLGEFTVRGDTIRRRMNVRTSHDGTSSLGVTMSSWRMVCSNGMYGWGADETVSIRHTTSWKHQMSKAREVLGIAERYQIWFQGVLDNLTKAKCTDVQVRAMASDWFNEETTKGQNAIQTVTELYRYGRGNRGETWYDAYNGLTEYVDHYQSRGRSQEKKDLSNTMGAGKRLKVKALQDIIKVATY
jgi:phage/plasmid-like protein (TIGR03299 family)